MNQHSFEKIFKVVLDSALPNSVWEWHGNFFQTTDAVKSTGLLPIIMRQAMCMLQSLRGMTGVEHKLFFKENPESLTGVEVKFSVGVPYAPLLLFALDAACMAQALAPGEDASGRCVVCLDVIERPIRLAPDTFFRSYGLVGEEHPREFTSSKGGTSPVFGQGTSF